MINNIALGVGYYFVIAFMLMIVIAYKIIPITKISIKAISFKKRLLKASDEKFEKYIELFRNLRKKDKQ